MLSKYGKNTEFHSKLSKVDQMSPGLVKKPKINKRIKKEEDKYQSSVVNSTYDTIGDESDTNFEVPKFKIPKAEISNFEFKPFTPQNYEKTAEKPVIQNEEEKLYTQDEVMIIVKAVIKELATILHKTGIYQQSQFWTLNSYNLLNFNSIMMGGLLNQNVMLQNALASQAILNGLSQSMVKDLNLNQTRDSLFSWLDTSSQSNKNSKIVGQSSQLNPIQPQVPIFDESFLKMTLSSMGIQ